jgi:hypothetical protein
LLAIPEFSVAVDDTVGETPIETVAEFELLAQPLAV